MAAVYVGEHLVVEHRVAIKVVHPRHLDNPRMTQRFLNEARAVAAIRHPGIVEFYDFGRADDGRAFIVMELLAGETLQSRLVNGPIAPAQALFFGRQMASALRAAHERDIVHRDLKPANVFLVPDPDVTFGERAKILDFGIAKHLTDEREEITGAGMLIGTPAHMSPEQCRGDKDIDGRADVYALGVLLYHMVTGRLPFDGEGTGEIVSRHLYEECPKATRVNPKVPVALSDVIARCMAKDRGRRYQTMGEVVDALSALRDTIDAPANLPPRPPPLRFAKGSRPPESASTWKHTLAHLPNVSNTPTEPFRADPPPAPVPLPAPTNNTSSTNVPTLTRTIVQKRSLLGRVRDRAPEIVLSTAAGVVVIAAAVVAMLSLRGMPGDAPPASATSPVQLEAKATPREEQVEAIERKVEKKEKKVEKKERPKAEEKGREPERARARARARTREEAKPKKTAKPKPAAPEPPEDPFESVSTPAVF